MAIEPVRWAPNQEERFRQYIHHELTMSLQGRQGLERQWRQWLETYRAPAKQPIKRFPFEGAANYMLPVTATDVDQLYAKFMQTIHAPENLWELEDLNERWTPAKKPLQDFLEWMDKHILKMWDVNKRAVLEMTKLGTAIYKTGWLYERRPYRTYDAEGKIVRQQRLRSVPLVDHVRLADFFLPNYSYNIQPDHQGGSPWVAERQRVNRHRFRWLFQSQFPLLPKEDQDKLDLIEQFYLRTQTLYDQKVQDLDYIKHARYNIPFDKSDDQDSTHAMGRANMLVQEIELFEVHARWDTRGDGSEDDLIGWYHMPTMTLLRPVYNYFMHGQRPYDVIRYFPGEGFYGIGVCEQKEMFQTAQSEMFNFTYDSVLLGNSIMLAAKAGSNIAPGEPIYPTKVWVTDGSPKDELMPFQMGTTRQDLPEFHALIANLAQQRTGVADLRPQDLPSRMPATTMLSVMQEGSRRPDLTLKDMRYEGMSTVGLRILQNCQQFIGTPSIRGDTRILDWATEVLGATDGQQVIQKLTTPMENVEAGIGVSLTATSGSANKEVERQSIVGLLQLAGGLYPQFLQAATVAQQSMDPQTGQMSMVGQVAMESMTGLTELFRRLLEQYDIRNPEAILPDVAQAQPAQPLPGLTFAPVGLNVGRGGATESPAANGAMGDLFQATGAGR